MSYIEGLLSTSIAAVVSPGTWGVLFLTFSINITILKLYSVSTEIHSFPPCTPERTYKGESYILLDLDPNTFFSGLRRALGYPLLIKHVFGGFQSLLFFVQFKKYFLTTKLRLNMENRSLRV